VQPLCEGKYLLSQKDGSIKRQLENKRQPIYQLYFAICKNREKAIIGAGQSVLKGSGFSGISTPFTLS